MVADCINMLGWLNLVGTSLLHTQFRKAGE